MIGAVALGGAVGALVRALFLHWAPDSTVHFPWTVFAVNLSGSVLLALLPGFAVVRRRPLMPPLLGTGVLGGYTTLSTFSEQTRGLVAGGHAATAATYVVGSLAACLVGVALASRFQTPAARRLFEAEEGDL